MPAAQGAVTFVGDSFSQKATAAITQHRFAKVDIANDNQVVQCSSAGELSLGICQNAPLVGDIAEIKIQGGSKLEVDAAVANGAQLTTSADGQGVTATTGQLVRAIALETASAAGQVISVIIVGPYAAA